MHGLMGPSRVCTCTFSVSCAGDVINGVKGVFNDSLLVLSLPERVFSHKDFAPYIMVRERHTCGLRSQMFYHSSYEWHSLRSVARLVHHILLYVQCLVSPQAETDGAGDDGSREEVGANPTVGANLSRRGGGHLLIKHVWKIGTVRCFLTEKASRRFILPNPVPRVPSVCDDDVM